MHRSVQHYHQSMKFTQQSRFVTRLGTVPHQTPHPPFREASESIEWVSCRCFLAWEGARFVQVKCKTSILASRVKFVEYQPMDVESLKKQVQLLRVLVAGCKKHPAYRAIRPATGNCEPCVKMWEAQQALKNIEIRNS